MTNPQNQPQTDPPPVTTPPADPPPATPPATKPPVVVQSGPDFAPLLDAIGSIPEKVANAVREQIPQSAPPASPATPAQNGDQNTGGNSQQTPTKSSGQTPANAATPAQGNAGTGRRTFAEWWHGAPRKSA